MTVDASDMAERLRAPQCDRLLWLWGRCVNAGVRLPAVLARRSNDQRRPRGLQVNGPRSEAAAGRKPPARGV
mgnify:CR=1 FL=1